MEEIELRTQKCLTPPTNHKQLLEPELACREPTNNFTSFNQHQVSFIESVRRSQPTTSLELQTTVNKVKEIKTTY